MHVGGALSVPLRRSSHKSGASLEEPHRVIDSNTVSHRLSDLCGGCEFNLNQMSGCVELKTCATTALLHYGICTIQRCDCTKVEKEEYIPELFVTNFPACNRYYSIYSTLHLSADCFYLYLDVNINMSCHSNTEQCVFAPVSVLWAAPGGEGRSFIWGHQASL